MPRKQCACGCREWFSGQGRQQFKNMAHYRSSAQFKAQWSTGLTRGNEVKRHTQRERLAGLGVLTAREAAIYARGHTNGYSAGFQMGRRKGFAEALGEADRMGA